MYTKAQYIQLHDPDLNMFWGIQDEITYLQEKGIPEKTYSPRLIVHRKVYDELRKLPWDFTITTDDTGLNVSLQRGITKISWI